MTAPSSPCDCDRSPVVVAVPADLRQFAPDPGETVTVCPRCLRLSTATPGEPDGDPSTVNEALPPGEAGVAVLLAVGLLESLATNRASIEATLEHAERAGADPLLAIDRLVADPAVDPAIDLERRRDQLEDFLY